MIAQLLASEGFTTIDEVAFVPMEEIAEIEGFDEDTAVELQTRAREHIEKHENELKIKLSELKVADELSEIPGLTTKLLVKLGENDIKNMEDFAGCATDELTGWTERKDGEVIRHAGIFSANEVSPADVEAMIMLARVKAGWITEEDLRGPEADEDTPEPGDEAAITKDEETE